MQILDVTDLHFSFLLVAHANAMKQPRIIKQEAARDKRAQGPVRRGGQILFLFFLDFSSETVRHLTKKIIETARNFIVPKKNYFHDIKVEYVIIMISHIYI